VCVCVCVCVCVSMAYIPVTGQVLFSNVSIFFLFPYLLTPHTRPKEPQSISNIDRGIGSL
jgi:hypothetical protein